MCRHTRAVRSAGMRKSCAQKFRLLLFTRHVQQMRVSLADVFVIRHPLSCECHTLFNEQGRELYSASPLSTIENPNRHDMTAGGRRCLSHVLIWSSIAITRHVEKTCIMVIEIRSDRSSYDCATTAARLHGRSPPAHDSKHSL